MGDPFAPMVDAATRFFADLAQNNTKDWFEPRKAEYVETIKQPAERFAEVVAAMIAAKTGSRVSPKVFRIYRDVRFSKDKTPYKPYLHLLWAPENGGPRWFFACEPNGLRVGMGHFQFDGARLAAYRAWIDREGGAIAADLAQLGHATGAEMMEGRGTSLKRVPAPYGKDHPQGDLLRRKDFAVFAPMAETWRDAGLVAGYGAWVEAALPLWRRLSSIADAG